MQQPLGPVCRQSLLDRKARALLALAREAEDDRRLALLEQAQGVQVEDADLKQLVVIRLQAEKERLASEQKEKTNKESIARMRDEHEKLLDELKALKGLRVEETSAGIKVILPEKDALRFAPNKADLDASGRATIGRIADLLKQSRHSDKRVLVIGHTDSTGNNHEPLSEARAHRVLQALVQHGVRRDRLEAQGAGATQPVGDNATAEGRSQNRRVEIIILKG